jgi:hypothetical protein
MKEEINRVSADLNVWRSREERFEKLFPGTLQHNRPFLKEKLGYLDGIQARYGSSANEMERLTLRILKTDRNRLAKVIYPNIIVRLLQTILQLFRRSQTEKRFLDRSVDNAKALEKVLDKTGFGQQINQLRQEIKKNQNEFTIPLSYYVNEKDRMDFSLSFTKNQSGDYQFDGFKAVLASEQNANGNRQHNFPTDSNTVTTAEQAYNLLAGRAVQFELKGGDQPSQTVWKQFDLNDKDNSGIYRMKEFQATYGYDLRLVISKLPIENDLSNAGVEKIVASLASGNRETISVKSQSGNQQFMIEANPQFKSLNVFNAQGKKIPLSGIINPTENTGRKQSKIIKIKRSDDKKKGLSA